MLTCEEVESMLKNYITKKLEKPVLSGRITSHFYDCDECFQKYKEISKEIFKDIPKPKNLPNDASFIEDWD